MKKRINWKILALSFLVVLLVAAAGSLFASSKRNTEWYQSIKPEITPPNYIFPLVWNILFTLIAISLYIAWTSSSPKQKNKLILFFGINLALNLVWSIIFFTLKNPALAFAELILFWLSIIYILIITYKINKISAYLLVPYLLWVTFAGYLNYLIVFQ
ncbi:tryptophan-rich sensory protein [Candidatus Pacearchaeota archaeon]|nr:tryptophan-rich sensory protein [Candidatus Pacearchaeota archaeon]